MLLARNASVNGFAYMARFAHERWFYVDLRRRPFSPQPISQTSFAIFVAEATTYVPKLKVLSTKQPKQLRVYLIHNLAKIIHITLKIHSITLYHQHPTFILFKDKLLIPFIQIPQVVYLHGLLILSTSFLYLSDQRWHTLAQINHQIRQLHHPFHMLKELHICLIITLAQVATLVIIGHEHVHTLKDTSVLHDRVLHLFYAKHIFESLFQEIRLHAE